MPIFTSNRKTSSSTRRSSLLDGLLIAWESFANKKVVTIFLYVLTGVLCAFRLIVRIYHVPFWGMLVFFVCLILFGAILVLAYLPVVILRLIRDRHRFGYTLRTLLLFTWFVSFSLGCFVAQRSYNIRLDGKLDWKVAIITMMWAALGASLYYSYGKDREYFAALRGETPLHLAAIKGNKRLIKSLVAHGADINALTKLGQTPFDLAFHENIGRENEITDLIHELGGKRGIDIRSGGLGKPAEGEKS